MQGYATLAKGWKYLVAPPQVSTEKSTEKSTETPAERSAATGVLYVVATPIGNLEDISQRALRVLAEADLIVAEDTRHSARLLRHYRIGGTLLSLHEHNEVQRIPEIIARLRRGEQVALISDAGTPLVSDPGYRLVRAVRASGLRVVPVPGPSAVLCALSAAGLPTDRFVFEGFLPPRPGARRRRLGELAGEPRTLVFFEAPQRITAALADLAAAFGSEREAVVARELTKVFETIRGGSLGELEIWVRERAENRRGEFVIVVHGALREAGTEADEDAERVLRVLLAELPLSQAVALAARLTAEPSNRLYRRALALSREDV